MSNALMNVEEVATELMISKAYAYKIIKRLNKETERQGYMTLAGRVNRQYFTKRFFYDEKRGKRRTGNSGIYDIHWRER